MVKNQTQSKQPYPIQLPASLQDIFGSSKMNVPSVSEVYVQWYYIRKALPLGIDFSVVSLKYMELPDVLTAISDFLLLGGAPRNLIEVWLEAIDHDDEQEILLELSEYYQSSVTKTGTKKDPAWKQVVGTLGGGLVTSVAGGLLEGIGETLEGTQIPGIEAVGDKLDDWGESISGWF